MRKLAFTLAFIAIGYFPLAQWDRSASKVQQLQGNLDDSNKVMALEDSGRRYVYNDVQKSIPYFISAYKIAQNINYEPGIILSLAGLGEALVFAGDVTKGLETNLEAVSRAETYKSKRLLQIANLKLATVYSEAGEYSEGIKYAKRTLESINSDTTASRTEAYLSTWGSLAGVYLLNNELDSALRYAQMAYEIDVRQPIHWGAVYHSLGNIHLKSGRYTLALEFFRNGLAIHPYAVDSIACYIGIADVYKEMRNADSVVHFANQAIHLAKRTKFPYYLANSYGFLKDHFKNINRLDSAFFYQDLILAIKDSVLSNEKLKAVQRLKFNEELKQLHLIAAERKAREEREHNLQYATIAIGLVSFIVLFFVLSSTIIVKENFIKFFGVLGLLLVFEFANFLLHPFVGELTNHSRILMFLVMVCIAALLVPGHHKIEKWLIEKLVEKNRKIRLESAKRTLATLEGK